ncbi:MAG: hypothetical protein ACYC0V_13705, partial [Armatimonadota bacterium]
ASRLGTAWRVNKPPGSILKGLCKTWRGKFEVNELFAKIWRRVFVASNDLVVERIPTSVVIDMDGYTAESPHYVWTYILEPRGAEVIALPDHTRMVNR